MKVKTEIWAGHEIRFVEKEPGEWWAVLADIANALSLDAKEIRRRLEKDVVSKHPLETPGGKQEMLIVNEYGVYETVFESRKKEAKEFKRWVFKMLKTLRQASGLEGFQVFRLLDKEHQKEAMSKLSRSLEQPKRISFIKANSIANKAISTKYGYGKMIKKKDMTPDMLIERQPILDDTVNLMGVVEKFGLDISVSDQVYKKHVN
ncbi:BRO family protein [Siminovitchia fortis]|uniref:Phage repressor protein n=1 Tax=Siminovitchia fortis TaxID=254758 RepID=A0A443IMN3_9BACI|nr:BRO family protein [Siminovitchia fortis]RWR06709.1 phage repressor protein [Siminovitchia fortis]WHY82973.1 BRO family protein [Siminovitchia fortis]